MSWSPGSWRRFEARQQPSYDDPEALRAAERALAARPPLVSADAAEALGAALAEAQAGRAFLVQGGECAESFDDDPVATARLVAGMAATIAAASELRPVAVGRIAGQFAKPRSQPFEARGGVALPAWRGDLVNGLAFDAAARRADPARMLRGYDRAAATLAAVGRSLFSSHEALLLPYEEALVRRDLHRCHASSGHFLWIGERTLFPGSAHVEFARGIANPLGLKCGPALAPDALLRLLDRLDPRREPGRITLIARMGAGRVAGALPPLIRAVRRAGRPVLWVCDPMHGNTRRNGGGRKLRRLADIVAETRAFFAIAAAEGVPAGGLHVETTAADVAECGDGAPFATGRCRSACDPRLNREQALALAELAGAELAKRAGGADGSGDAHRLDAAILAG